MTPTSSLKNEECSLIAESNQNLLKDDSNSNGVGKCLSIELDNSSVFYHSGQILKGRVLLCSKSPQDVKGLKIQLVGKERVNWPEDKISTDVVPTFNSGGGTFQPVYVHKTETVDVVAEKEFLSWKLSLAGDGQRIFKVKDGCYPFKLALPKNLPSTFTHEHGKVSYLLTAELIRQAQQSNLTAELPITVIGVLDLSQNPTARQSQIITATEKDGQISFTVNLKRSGYVPGERLNFTCEIINNSSTTVEYVRASIIQAIKFQMEEAGPCKTATIPVIGVESVPVYPKSDITWRAPYRTIPIVPPSGLGGSCKLIDIQYYLQFKVSISGFIINSSIDERLPIIIGTVPLQGIA